MARGQSPSVVLVSVASCPNAARGRGRPWRPLTFDGDDELRDDGEDLAPAVLQHVMDALPCEELVGEGHLAESVEEQGQVVVVVQLLDLHLQGQRTGRREPRAGQSQASHGPGRGEPALPASGHPGPQFPGGLASHGRWVNITGLSLLTD